MVLSKHSARTNAAGTYSGPTFDSSTPAGCVDWVVLTYFNGLLSHVTPIACVSPALAGHPRRLVFTQGQPPGLQARGRPSSGLGVGSAHGPSPRQRTSMGLQQVPVADHSLPPGPAARRPLAECLAREPPRACTPAPGGRADALSPEGPAQHARVTSRAKRAPAARPSAQNGNHGAALLGASCVLAHLAPTAPPGGHCSHRPPHREETEAG